MVICGTVQRGERTITINVDRYQSLARRAVLRDIRWLALSGSSKTTAVGWRLGSSSESVLADPAHREIELRLADCGVFVLVGPDKFEWIKTRSRADAEQLIAT
jgi:hypothetical protein